MARPLRLNGGRPPALSVRVVTVINRTTVDVEATRDGARYGLRVVLYGDEIRVRGTGVPRVIVEGVRRWARRNAVAGHPVSQW